MAVSEQGTMEDLCREARELLLRRGISGSSSPVSGLTLVERLGDALERDATTPTEAQLDAGCAVLYGNVAEAYEPHWRDLLGRIYVAMQASGSVR